MQPLEMGIQWKGWKMKSRSFHALLVVLGVSMVGSVWAKDGCTRVRPAQVRQLSDACISQLSQKLEADLDRRYEKIAAQLPAVGTPESEDEFEGISQQSAKLVYANWKAYADSSCVLVSGRLGLNRKYESRERTICWISEAQRHLNAVKGP